MTKGEKVKRHDLGARPEQLLLWRLEAVRAIEQVEEQRLELQQRIAAERARIELFDGLIARELQLDLMRQRARS